ncbi:mitochondrial enolase superfamily member 1 [Grus japonensis]|uniref:Mitochondrial enolase superfamily member 1 n=1 Tax=Grus japonensis TaxID=30415 RepID=A0ABC9WD52_GRUJA
MPAGSKTDPPLAKTKPISNSGSASGITSLRRGEKMDQQLLQPEKGVQDFTLSLDKPHEVPIGPFPQPVQFPLDGSTTFWCINHSSQWCVISKLAEVAFYPIFQIIDEDVEQDWTQH